MFINSINTLSVNQQINNSSFKSKKILTKHLQPDDVLKAMALMTAPLLGSIAANRNLSSSENTISNKDFKQMKAVVEEVLKLNNIDTNIYKVTKNNVLLVSNIIQHPLIKDKVSNENFGILIKALKCKNQEEQNAKIIILDMMSKDTELFDTYEIFSFMNSSIKDSENVLKLYDCVVSNKPLYDYLKDEAKKNNLKRYSFSDLYYHIGSNTQLLQKIMDDENLKDSFKILIKTNYYKDENYEEILNTLSKKPELLSNENVVTRLSKNSVYNAEFLNGTNLNKILNIEDEDVINNILQAIKNFTSQDLLVSDIKSSLSFMNSLFATNKLYKNKNLAENLEKILNIKPRSEKLRADKVAIIKKVDSNEKLMQNKELMDNIGKILVSMKTHDKFEQIISQLDFIANS